jgi:GntR family transcriptional regulator
VLVGIASGWPEFLKLARTVLIAAGFHKDALLFRDARRPNWHRGLQQTAAVVCDSATAADLPKTCRAIIFPVLSDSSLAELKQYQEFIRNQLSSAL